MFDVAWPLHLMRIHPVSLLPVTFSSPAGLLSFLSNSKPIPAVSLCTCYISCWGVYGGWGSVSPSWIFSITLFHYWVKSCSRHLLAVWLWQTLISDPSKWDDGAYLTEVTPEEMDFFVSGCRRQRRLTGSVRCLVRVPTENRAFRE